MTRETVARIQAALSGLRVPAAPGEYDLHALIAQALAAAGLLARHEVPLGPRKRIDFLVDDVGIEVKRGKCPPKKLRDQAEKYLSCPELGALVLVANEGVKLPGAICGKPVVVLGLNRLWGVALP